jgi:hypothetical protein
MQDEDMDFIYDQLVQDYGAVSFEAFINLLVDITEDQTSAEQLRESFRGIAADKVSLVGPQVHLPSNMVSSPSLLNLTYALLNFPPMRSNTSDKRCLVPVTMWASPSTTTNTGWIRSLRLDPLYARSAFLTYVMFV